jgi:hypothetical protein
VSASVHEALLADLERDPELAARYAAVLRPYLPTEDEEPPRLLTADEASARLRKDRRTLIRAASDGRVTGATRVGRSWMFDPATLALAPPARAKPSREPLRPRPQRHAGRDAAAAIRGHQPERTPTT